MLALLKLLATLAAGASCGLAVFDGGLHALLLRRTKYFRRHLGLLLFRAGYSVLMSILLWYVIVPAPVAAWSSPQAWGFIAALFSCSIGLTLSSGDTYSMFVDETESGRQNDSARPG